MAKRNYKKVQQKTFEPKILTGLDLQAKTFKTSRGKVLQLREVPRFLIDARMASRPKIEPPTYEVKTAGGDIEKHTHDETTLLTADDKEAWAKYVSERDADAALFSADMFRILISEGLELTVPDTYKQKLKSYGITIVIEEDALKLNYLQSEFIGEQEDATDLMAAILAVSSTNMEAAEQLAKSFRAAIQEARVI